MRYADAHGFFLIDQNQKIYLIIINYIDCYIINE